MRKIQIGDKVVRDNKSYSDLASWEEAKLIGYSHVRGECYILKSTSGTIYHIPVAMPLTVVAPRPKYWIQRVFNIYTYKK